jgi:hypothetical protein
MVAVMDRLIGDHTELWSCTNECVEHIILHDEMMGLLTTCNMLVVLLLCHTSIDCTHCVDRVPKEQSEILIAWFPKVINLCGTEGHGHLPYDVWSMPLIPALLDAIVGYNTSSVGYLPPPPVCTLWCCVLWIVGIDYTRLYFRVVNGSLDREDYEQFLSTLPDVAAAWGRSNMDTVPLDPVVHQARGTYFLSNIHCNDHLPLMADSDWIQSRDHTYCARDVIDACEILSLLQSVQVSMQNLAVTGTKMWNQTGDLSSGFSRAIGNDGVLSDEGNHVTPGGSPDDDRSITMDVPVQLQYSESQLTDGKVGHCTMRLIHGTGSYPGITSIAAGCGPKLFFTSQTRLMRGNAGGCTYFWVLAGAMELCVIDDTPANR